MVDITDAIYSGQLDGMGGMVAISSQQQRKHNGPDWLHLDYKNPISMQWLADTELLGAAARKELAGKSQKPHLSLADEGVLITFRTVNKNATAHPEQLIALRIYITEKIIISTQHCHLAALQEVVDDLTQKIGPTDSSSWLVVVADRLTEQVGDLIETLYNKIILLEDHVIEQKIPPRGQLALLRKQLMNLHRHIVPQRDLLYRLANGPINWLRDDDRRNLQEIAERLGRSLDDLDSGITRTAMLSEEITSFLTEVTNRRANSMSLLAVVFVPISFLTGLFGVNLGGIPGSTNHWAFVLFSMLMIGVGMIVFWWVKYRR